MLSQYFKNSCEARILSKSVTRYFFGKMTKIVSKMAKYIFFSFRSESFFRAFFTRILSEAELTTQKSLDSIFGHLLSTIHYRFWKIFCAEKEMSNSFPKSCSTSWYVCIFLTNQSWMTIFHSWSWRNEKLISMGREQKGTDVDQQFTLFCFQTVLNGILMATFTTRSFAKKNIVNQCITNIHTVAKIKMQFLSINWIFKNNSNFWAKTENVIELKIICQFEFSRQKNVLKFNQFL